MKAVSHRLGYLRSLATLLATLTLLQTLAQAASIVLTAPTQISLPSIEVASYPQTVYSGDYTLELFNSDQNDGWFLTGEVLDQQLVGLATSETLPSQLVFKSIAWISGGQGSAAGIAISPDGSSIEADPGFGIGTFSIVFEIQYEVPAFPRADAYQGTCAFAIQ